MEHFWLIWNELGHAPTFKHSTPESAYQEAERLAINTPGQKFHVLQVVRTAQYARVQWHEYGDFIPF